MGVEVGPELDRDHFGHVKAEAIHSLAQPELGDVLEFFPGVGHRFSLPKRVMGTPIQGRCIGGQFGKLLFALWANPVVYFDGLVPIVEVGLCLSGAIARPFGGVFLKLAICQGMFFTSQGLVAIFGFRNSKGFPRDVVEVVVFVVSHCLVVSSTEILNSIGIVFTFVMTRHVVGHDVDDHLHVLGMRSGNQRFKFFHASGDIHGKIWIDLVVVPHRIGRSCTAFDHVWIV